MILKNSIVKLLPGMYILRHPKGGLPPISVGRAFGSADSVGRAEAIFTSKTHGTILRDGSDCIVMHVSVAPVELLVTAYLASADDTIPALRIDEIGLDPEPSQSPALAMPTPIPEKAKSAAGNTKATFEIAANGISMIGHIERTGDSLAGVGETLGDAQKVFRLEGFQIMWPDRPEGVELAYTATIEGQGTLPPVVSGNFCGTRGQGQRITEVTISLVGPKAKEYELEGLTHFSGGFQVPMASGLAMGGPSGLEHLTAISLAVVSARPPNGKSKSPWDASARTKVLKAKTTSKK
jgi:hypothetical protein